jgi:hypothetical protein
MKSVDRKDHKKEKKDQWQPILARHVQERKQEEQSSGEGTNECGGTDSANEGKKKDGWEETQRWGEDGRPKQELRWTTAAAPALYSHQFLTCIHFSVTSHSRKRDHSIMSIAFRVQHLRPLHYSTD